MKIKQSLLLLLTSGIFVTTGCTNTGTSSSQGETTLLEKEEIVRLSASSMIPLVNGGGSRAQLIVTNLSHAPIKLTKTIVDGDFLTEKNIDVKQCNTIVADGGTCTLSVSIPAKSGNSMINLSFEDEHKHTYNTATILSYQDTPHPSNGFYYYVTNNETVTPKGSKGSYVLPMVLAEDYKDLKVSSSSPFATGSLNCDANSYLKGVHCDVVLNYQAGDYTTDITLEATNKKDGKKSTVKVPYTVRVGSEGYIMAGTSTVIIDKANGQDANSKKVYLLNYGLTTSTINSITADSKISTSHSCTSLIPRENCTVTVNANSAQHGQGRVNVTYDSNKNTGFNVVYRGVEDVGLLLQENLPGALLATTVNDTATTSISVKNTGTSELQKIKFAKLTNSDMQYSTVGSGLCKIDGSQNLSAQESCTLSIQYIPKVPHGRDRFSLNAVATYTKYKMKFDMGYPV